ncbi:MAG: hypothetical protein AABO41_16250 [Acidobacteriota bacterium]
MNDPVSRADKNRFGSVILLFGLFFLICFGLGYATLKRYDPRLPGNNPDSAYYYEMVTGEAQQPVFLSSYASVASRYGYRILIPWVARPFYWLARGRIGTWDPVFFSLLVANSLFVAATASVLVRIGRRVTGDYSIALLAAMLYLLNFAIANFQLAGFVDSGEAFFMMLVVWCLLANRWALLPLCGVLGALAKETFVPFSVVLGVVWWIAARRRQESRVANLGWVMAMGVAGVVSMTSVQSLVSGQMVWPWRPVVLSGSPSTLLINLVHCVASHEVLYVFGWLLPLGAVRLGQLPRPWVLASAVTAFVALVLGASVDAHGNVSRAMFDVAGPMLSLSVAMLIGRTSESRENVAV